MLRTAQRPRFPLKTLLAGATLTVAFTVVLAGGALAVQDGPTVPEGKVGICKYMGTPGDAVLRSGNNPVEVWDKKFRSDPFDTVEVGDVLVQGNGYSIVVAVAGDPHPTIEDCPSA